MSTQTLRIGAFVVGVSLVLVLPAVAQRTTGEITGIVRDDTGGVLPGVTISAIGANAAGTHTTTTTDGGNYRIGNLPPGLYDLSYTLQGFRTVTVSGLVVSVGSTVEQSVTLAVSAMAEQVTVEAQSPVVDTTSNEVGTTFNADWVGNAPSRRFGFYDLVAMAPGSVKGGDGTVAGERRTMVFGGSFDENSFQLDGVNVTDNFFNEGFSEPSPDAIQEVEVLSLGAPAEYGNLMGAVYNIVTKQGSNAFHGEGSVYFQSDGLTSNNTNDITLPNGVFADACSDDPTNRCPWTRGDYYEVSAQLGGPILKDKLWFFGSYGHQKDEFTRVGVNSNLPGSALNTEKDRYFGKLNWQINDNHRIIGNFHYDKSPQDQGYSFNETPSTAWTYTRKAPTPGVSYTATLSNKTLLDVRYSGFYGSATGFPTDPSQPLSERRIFHGETGLITGGHYYWYEYDAKRNTATAKLSHYADSFLGGAHDLKFGVQYNNAGVSGIYGYNDFVYTYNYNGQIYGYGNVRQPFSYSGESNNIGFFADDAYRIGDRLTLNLGVRFDHSSAFSNEQEELDANAQPTGVIFPHTDFFTWNNWSPRFGVNWKLTEDAKTVIKAHWGRYQPQVTTGEFANVIGPNVKPYYQGTYNAATGEITDLNLLSSSENLRVSPDYHAPRTDQFLIGMEQELSNTIGVQLNYVRKWGRDFAAWEDTVGTYVQVPVVDDVGQGATGRTIDVFSLTSNPDLRLFALGNSDRVRSDVHAVSATLTKRMTRWYANVGVTWLRAEGLLGGSVRTTSIQQRSGLEFSQFGRNPNDLVNASGRLNGDTTWQFKLQTVVQLGAGFQVSANLDHHDGPHLFRIRAVPESVAGISSTVFMQPRGELGRLEDVTILDARLQWDAPLGGDRKLAVFVDALNLNNENAAQTVQSANVTSGVYHYPSTFVAPRRLMLGTKFSF